MQGLISFDTELLESGQPHIEGCYKLPKGEWTIFYFTHYRGGKLWSGNPEINRNAVFSSGLRGVDAVFPDRIVLNKASAIDLLSNILGDVMLVEVRGPDSLMLK